MIISHQYKYLFVELPRTASTAISKELCENYGGIPILHKHATYYEFLKTATPEEKKYFVFSGIRNPLDSIVSVYFKYKTDHDQRFSNPNVWKRGYLTRTDRKKYNLVKNNNADFSTYFKKFYRFPFVGIVYDDFSALSHKDFGFLIRFEYLQDDFAQVLKLIGVEQKRPLPVSNKTSQKDEYALFYTPEIRDQARRVFGPYMKRWGYDFPSEWGNNSVPLSSQILFNVLGIFRKFYWKHLQLPVVSFRKFSRRRLYVDKKGKSSISINS